MVYCDNLVSVEVINTGRCRNPFMLKCLRELLFCAAQFEFEIRASHIKGVDNRIADRLSRWYLDKSASAEFYRMTNHISKLEYTVTAKHFEFTHDW